MVCDSSDVCIQDTLFSRARLAEFAREQRNLAYNSDVRKFLKKSKFQNFSELFKVKTIEIIIDRYSNMRAFTYDVCSNLGVSK